MAETPLEAYRALLASGGLKEDPAQELAAEKLNLLHYRLKSYSPKPKGLLSLFQKREPAPEGIYLYGEVGRGKSMLMDMFFETAPVEPKRRVHFNEFMGDVHRRIFAWRNLDKAGRDKRGGGDDPIPPIARELAREAILLCFDEFQVHDVADAMILARLFSALFENGVVVVATSNRDPDDLYQGGLNRPLFLPFIDLLKRELDVLHLTGGTDYRRHRLAGKPVYFTPLNSKAERALDEAWALLTDAADPAPFDLEVLGRKVRIPALARHVARASFHDLCATALAAQDYLALADVAHTLILEGVPSLNPDKRNEARRFVLLVDVLYDKRRRLIMSAAAEPDRLYPAGDGSFEFQRTASRLDEMRSAGWIEE